MEFNEPMKLERESLHDGDTSPEVTSAMPQALNLSTRAIFRSGVIHPDDRDADPVNYWIGMWGKLIILGAVKRQGILQNLNPEVEYANLNWNAIYEQVSNRTPNKMKRYLSAESCCKWFENRINAYKTCFPFYMCYESAIDQLIRHYAIQLQAIRQTSPDPDKLYWENPNPNVLALPAVPQEGVGNSESTTANEVKDKQDGFMELLEQFAGAHGMDALTQSLAENLVGSDITGDISNFTIPAIRGKILSGEICDVSTLMDHCRCMVSLSILSGRLTKIPANLAAMQEALRQISDAERKKLPVPGMVA